MNEAFFEFRLLRPILVSLQRDGVDLGPVLKRRGLPGSLEACHGDTELSIVDYFRIQKDIALAADDLTAQFSRRRLTFRTGHFVVSQLQQAQTLVAAMERLADHFNMMHGDTYNSVRTGQGVVALVINDKAFPYSFDGDEALFHFIGECLLIKVHCLLDSLSGGLAERAIRRVRIQREGKASGTSPSGFWDVPLDRGRDIYELVYDHDLASRHFSQNAEIDMSASGLYNRVIDHLESHLAPARPTLAERTREMIEDGCQRQDEVARRLGISVATHRRKLQDHGLSFRKLVQENRLRRAEAMLLQGQSVTQVAEALDYSDIRAFTRAYKQMRGITPATFARQNARDNGRAGPRS